MRKIKKDIWNYNADIDVNYSPEENIYYAVKYFDTGHLASINYATLEEVKIALDNDEIEWEI